MGENGEDSVPFSTEANVARKSGGPWYWVERRAWYCVRDKKRYHLVSGPQEETEAQAHEEYRRLTEAVDPRVQRIVAVLRGRPELIPAVLRVIEVPAASAPAAGDVATKVAEWKSAFSTVNWTALAHAVMDGTLKAGADAFIDGEKWKSEFLNFAPNAWKAADHGWWEREMFGTGKPKPEVEYKNAVEGLPEMFGLKASKPEEFAPKLKHLAVLYPAED